MKRLVTLLFSALLFAQVRSVTLTWVDGVNPTGTTYNVYRAPGACSVITNTYVKINTSAVAALTYIDTTVVPGIYCYAVTAVSGTPPLESTLSMQVNAVIMTTPPVSITLKAQ